MFESLLHEEEKNRLEAFKGFNYFQPEHSEAGEGDENDPIGRPKGKDQLTEQENFSKKMADFKLDLDDDIK